MELYSLKAHETIDLIEKKQVTVREVIECYIKRIEDIDDKIGAFLFKDEEGALKRAEEIDNKILKGIKPGRLWGLPIGVKDNICVKAMKNTCGSKMLENYISPYDSQVAEAIKKEDGIIIGKLNMDEFAMGSSNENSAFNVVRNPWDLNRVPGGSSGGSSAAVASYEVPFSLGTDTGGSVRQPAAFCGVVGLKPTYGRISRYGIVAFGSTLDQVGPIARDVRDCALLTQCLAGKDKKDSTTAEKEVADYARYLHKDLRGKKVGIPKEFFGEGLEEGVRAEVNKAIRVLEENGALVEECSMKLIDYALPAYYIISSGEASSNLARFDGVKYGLRSEVFNDYKDIYYKTRSEGFGKEVKRRIMLGTYVLSSGYYDEYYKKALKVRSLIIEEFKSVFKKYDALVCPVAPTTAFKLGEKSKDVLSMYLSDKYTVPASIAGIPAISVPCGMCNGLPVGIQIMGNYFEEETLFQMAYSLEQTLN